MGTYAILEVAEVDKSMAKVPNAEVNLTVPELGAVGAVLELEVETLLKEDVVMKIELVLELE